MNITGPIASNRSPQRGMTLIEIMVVLAIMGLGMALFLGGNLLKSNEARLREGAVEVLATLRGAHNMATMTGKHHRVVFNLKEQTYHLEVCMGAQTLKRGDEEEVVDTDKLEKLRERMEQPVSNNLDREVIEANSPEEALAAAAALAGIRIGTTRCQPATATLSGQASKSGNKHKLDVGRGIHISEIHVQHLIEPVKEGIVSINFFPVGSAEKAMIEIGNGDGDTHTILLYGMTSRVAFRRGSVDAEDHMRRNAVGDEVEE